MCSNAVRESTAGERDTTRNLDEAALIALAQAGSSEAFGELVRTYRDSLFKWCVHSMGSVDEAEDVMQEVFADAFVGIRRFRGDSQLHTWLFGIARFKVHKFVQERRRRGRVMLLLNGDDGRIDGIPHDVASPEDELVRRELITVTLTTMIESLPEQYGIPLKLLARGLKRREIAAELDWPIGTVKSRISRGIARLRKKVASDRKNPTLW